MKKHHVRALARPIATVVLVAASAAAFANNDTPATGDNGAMTFANVKVVNKPATIDTTGTTVSAGMRAAKDQDTGEFRAPTASEVAELDAQAKAAKNAAKPNAAKTTQVTVRKTDHGTQAISAGDEFMSYEVVHKDANGKLVEQCVTGEKAADQALSANVATQGVQHDR
jgi:hypothetical protein